MSPLLTVIVGGALGGIASGLVISLFLALFGRRVAESLLHQQVAYLETRFKENVLEVMLGRIASFLDQGERISQIVKKVVEVVQLLVRRGKDDPPPLDAAAALAKPVPAPTNGS
jgi:hypothetical protein